MADATPLLEIRDLCIRYGRRGHAVDALRDVSLSLGAGERVGVVGESGSGKSTLALAPLRALGASGRVTGGTMHFRGDDISALSARALQTLRCSGIGLVQQEPMAALNPSMTIGRQLREVPKLAAAGAAADTIDDRIQAMLAEVGLEDGARILAAYPHQLSGGQLQRVCLAMVLLGEPALLILDEPTTALDTRTSAAIVELIREMADRHGIALLLISHDLGLVGALTDRVLVMRDGEVIDRGTVPEMFAGGNHPYTAGLVRSVAAGSPGHAEAPPSRPDTQPFIRFAGIEKSYPLVGRWGGITGKVAALRGLDLDVAPGETLALVGESGCGKSTLGRILAGLEAADSGSVTLDGREIGATPVEHRPRGVRLDIQMVFQDPDGSLNPSLSVGRQLSRALISRGDSLEANATGDLLEMVQLPADVAARLPRELSGGQKQRVAIARAFAARPRIVIADEPVSALDATLRRDILELLNRLQREHGTALLLISHDLMLVRWFADRVAVLREGAIVECGPVASVLEAPGHAYTRALLAAARAGAPAGIPFAARAPIS
jgi:peptide/nickel transport system ATP-binding protein